MDQLHIAIGIIGALIGFGASELFLVVKISARVSAHEVEIKNIKEDKSETNDLIKTVMNQNTAIMSQLGVK